MGGKKAVEKNREWEKGRRDKLNQSFSELSKLLPDHDPSITLSKMEVLNRAAMYIKTLQRQNQDILNDGKQTFLDDEVDRLQKRVAHLVFKTKLLVDALRNAGVPIPEVKPPKSRNRKKQEPKPPECIENKTAVTPITDQSGDVGEQLLLPDDVILLDEPLKNSPKPSNNSLSCTSSSLKALEESLKLTDGAIKPPEGLCRAKDIIKISKEPLKEINSTIASVSIPKDVPSVSQASQPPPISVAVKEQPILTGSLPGVITSINQAQSSTLQNFTFLERSLVNLGPGTLILADGRVVNVPPPMPQIVVKPQPTLILMQKTVRREKRLYPKPKQVDVTRTTFTNKAPIPTIKHINFEFKTKRSRIKVTKTRLSPKQIKKKEPTKSKVVAKSNVLEIDGEIQVEMNETVESIKTTETLSISEIDKNSDEIQDISEKIEASMVTTSAKFSSKIEEKEISEKVVEEELLPVENSKIVDKLVSKVCHSVADSETIGDNGLNIDDEYEPAGEENCTHTIERNDFGDDHLKELDQVITTAHEGDKIPEDNLNNIHNNSLIQSEELKSFSPVNNVNSIETIADGCTDANQSFENELTIHSSDAFKKRNNSQIKDTNNDFSKKESTQKTAFTDASNTTSNHLLNDNSLTRNNKNSEMDLNHLSNNDTLLNLQNCAPNVPPDKNERGSMQEQMVLFRDESNHGMKNDRNLSSLNSGNRSDLQNLNSSSCSDLQNLNSSRCSDLQSLNSSNRSDIQSLNSSNLSDLQSLNSDNRSDLQSLNSGNLSDLQDLNSGHCSDLQSLNSGNRSGKKANQDLLKTPDSSMNCGKQFQNIPSNDQGNVRNLPSNDHSNVRSLASNDHGNVQNLPPNDHCHVKNLLSNNHGNVQSLPSSSHGNVQRLPPSNHGNVQSLPSSNHGNVQSLPSSNHGIILNLPSDDHSNVRNLPSYEHSNVKNLPSNNHGNVQNLPSSDHRDIQSKTVNNKSFPVKNVSHEDRSKLQNNTKKLTNPTILPNNENNTYFTSPNVIPISEKSSEEFYSGQRRIENCRSETFDNQSNVSKMSYNTEPTQCNNAMPVETYSTQSAVVNKGDYNCKDKRLFEGNNQNLKKDVFNAMPSTSSVSNQNFNTQPFVNLSTSQNCRMTRAETYPGNCDLMKETYNNSGKSPCKEMFVNYLNNPLNKSPYTDQNSLNKESFGNSCDSAKNYFNQSSLNHQAMYANQYNSLNNSFINQNNRVYGKESFPNQCDNFNYANEKSSSKDTYSCQNRPLNKDLYANQNKAGYQNQNSILNKDSCVGSNSSLNKDAYREQTMSLTNQCNVLNKDSYSTNKDCYVSSNQSSSINTSLNKETYNRSVNTSKNVDNNRSNSVSKDTMTNTPGQSSGVSKAPYESQKSLTADKACQPEMPLCRNISSSEFMEVVNQGVMRGNAKNSETANIQLRSSENRGNIGEIRSAGCSVNNPMYGSNQSVTTFSNNTEHSGNMTFVGTAQKRNKEGIYNNKNNSGIVCKYTIDSLFKNGDINGPQVNIGSTPRDKVPDNTATCKTHLHKRNSAPYEIEGLPIVNEPSLNHSQGQLYQNESNPYAITSRETGNICGNMIGNNMRNEMSLTNNGCNMAQQTDMLNSNNCKTNISNNEKNNQNNKIYTNTNNDATFNKNDPMLISSDLMKSKDLDRNNFMPLLDDVRLTTDFSSDLFSSFQVAPGGQHPESMSPTAAFLLAFPLVSTSKTADSINENDNPEHNSSTPTTILQIGNIEQPNPDMFHSQVDSLRSKPVSESNKEYERYAHYDVTMYDNVPTESTKRKSSQSQSFTDQSNNCSDKNYRRSCDTRKRPRNQPELPTYTQSYSYPIFPNNNDFAQFTNSTTDPKTDGLSVPWTMNLNQDFSTQPVQKDVCTSTTKPLKSTERKNSKSDKQQILKNNSYSCSQQGSQTVDYYASKPERKKQKTSHSKTPVNWMAPAEPPKNTFVEPPLAQIDVYQNNKEQDGNLLSTNQTQNVYNNIVSSLEVPFDSVCFSDFGNKKSNNYSWSPSKSLLPALDNHNFVIPSTLPTLVGDLALGTSTPAETYKSFEDNRKFEQPKKADKSSSTFLDSAAQTSTSSSTTKKRVDYNTKTQANSNTFLSVSQLVDPKSQKQSKMNEIKNMKRNESHANKDKFQNCQNINSRREQEQNCIYSNRNEIPNNCWNDKQQKNQYKGNYSAESLIAAQPTPETPDAFHLNFNNYQAQSNYFHGDFTENNQLQQSSQQYQNYFNQSASHFPTFLGEEYAHEFSSSGSQRKKKSKENTTLYPPTIHSKDAFSPLQKDNSAYLNSLPKDTGSYQAPGLLSQGYRNCIKIGVPPHVGQHTNTTSTLTNFNLSTIFPEMNDQRISGGSSQPPHINPNFSSLPLHNYPPH